MARVRALRGATTIDEDTADQIMERVTEMLHVVLAENDVEPDDIISMWFTATDDIHSQFPATAARAMGIFDDVPLMCARELDIPGALARCVRVMIHIETDRARRDLRHVYLHGARALRPDLSV